MRTITVSAPLPLSFGETHSPDGPVLFTAVNLRSYVTLSESKSSTIITPRSLSQTLRSLLNNICRFYKFPLPSFKLTIVLPEVEIPETKFQTSVKIATAGALSWYLKDVWNPHVINNLVYEINKKSDQAWGAQVTVTTFGGIVWFRQELSYLKSVWQLPIKLSPEINRFYLNLGPAAEEKNLITAKDVKSLAEAFKTGKKDKIRRNLSKFQRENVYLSFVSAKNKAIPVMIGEEGVRIENKST